MKILLIIPTLNRAGAEKIVLMLANNLADKPENRVILCTLFNQQSWLKENFKEELSDKVTLFSLGKKLGFDFKIILKLYFLIIKQKPNVVHTHLDALNYIFFARILTYFNKIKYFHTVHSQSDKEVKSKILYNVRRFFYNNKLIHPITISELSKLSFEKHFNLNSVMIENCINLVEKSNKHIEVEKFISELKTKYDKVFVSIGNLVIAKNQIELAASFKLLQNNNHNICLLIIGSSRTENYEIFETLNQDKPSNVFLLGGKSNATDYLYYCDAFILPSIYEGLPITLLEALSIGCVPICTKVGGIPNVITHKENGYLIENPSKEAIVKSVELFLNSKKDLSETCKVFFKKRFSINNYIQKHEDIYTYSK